MARTYGVSRTGVPRVGVKFTLPPERGADPMPFADLPFVRAAQAPDAPALADEARSLTSAEFAGEVEERAGQPSLRRLVGA